VSGLAYTTTKFAVVGFDESTGAGTIRNTGVRFNCICPRPLSRRPSCSRGSRNIPIRRPPYRDMASTQLNSRHGQGGLKEVAAAALYLAAERKVPWSQAARW